MQSNACAGEVREPREQETNPEPNTQQRKTANRGGRRSREKPPLPAGPGQGPAKKDRDDSVPGLVLCRSLNLGSKP
jgi:hypothetical protein